MILLAACAAPAPSTLPWRDGTAVSIAVSAGAGIPDFPESTPAPAPQADVSSPAEGEKSTITLEDMVITAPPLGRRDLLLPRSSRVVDAATIERRNVLTTPDALEEEVGVVVQKTELGGGSPIIRGRTGKEILYLIDGQRFNNMTFRRNTQYLNTVDLNAVDRIEVIRGPASVVYGSDAMGGAVNLVTSRRDPDGVNDLGGRLFIRFESAARGLMSHLGIEGELEGFGFTAGATGKSFGDLQAGSHGDPAGAVDIDGRQDPTGYRERDWSFSLTRALDEEQSLDFLALQSHLYGVPRSDRLIANDKQPVPPDLLNEYDPQISRWYALRYRRLDSGATLESMVFTLSLNNPEEGRRRIKRSDPDMLILERDEVFAPGFTARFGLNPHWDHLVALGFETYLETIDSSGARKDLATGIVTPEATGRYPDDSRFRSLGVYVEDEWTLREGLTWTNGIRYSAARVDLDFGGIAVGPLPPFGELKETYDDVTFASTLSVGVAPDTLVYGSISRGFRTPNLDDLAALGDFAAGGRVPNLDLDPETVLSFEAGATHTGERLETGASAAAAFYQDLLDNQFLFSEGGEDYFQVGNVARAVVYSFESWADWVVKQASGVSPRHVLFSQAFFNIGRNKTAKEPLSKVPPAQGLIGYRLEEERNAWFAEAFFRCALEQDRLSASDEADPRIPIGGTPFWWTFNLRSGLDVAKGARLIFTLENLFDQRYRVHGSGIDAPGLNAILSLDVRY